MHLIKLNATTSTNSYLKQLALKKPLGDFTVVVCDHQTTGRGQKGNSWVSEAGKNLTVSILKKFDGLRANQGFGLNCIVSLAIYEVLCQLPIPDVKVKWPNDIMSGNKKLCGILIENALTGSFINRSIIGFGLNVNQTVFNGLPNATSLKLESGIHYDLGELLDTVLNRLNHYLEGYGPLNFIKIKKEYEAVLFRRGVSSEFTFGSGEVFNGTIRGITETGQLTIEREKGELLHFNFKEVQFVH